MAQYLDDVVDRIHAVLCQGRGADGALGTDAQARSIAAGQFRRPSNDLTLRDPQYPGGDFDTAACILWDSSQDEPDVDNELDPNALTTERFTLLVGYLYGAGLEGLMRTRGSESAATAAANWRRRAIGDARRIKQALCFTGLSGGALSSGVSIVGMQREGATTLEELPDAGRAISVTVYQAKLLTPRGSSYNP